MRKSRLFTGLAMLAIAISSAVYVSEALPNVIEKDNIIYNDVTPTDVTQPRFASDDEEEEEEVKYIVDKITLHYVNDENDCQQRAFYVWCTGVDGVEYSDANASDIVSYVSDGSQMSIVIDINGDARFSAFKNRNSIFYIIKFKKKSDSDLNWGGQSDDVELKYSEFPPENNEVEVWSTPAAGGGIAQFSTEAETKVDGIKLAKFTDWKTIHCTVTDTCLSCEWKLYAYDETYYKIKAKNRKAYQKDYLVMASEEAVNTRMIKEFDIKFDYTAHINIVYCLVSKDPNSGSVLEKTIYVGFDELYDDARFEKYYTHYVYGSENDLGMFYNKSAQTVTISVWSPVSAKLSLLLYRNTYDDAGNMTSCGGTPTAYEDDEHKGNDKYDGYDMTYTPGGVWKVVLSWTDEKDSPLGRYYAIQCSNSLGSDLVTMDPYATACGICGVRAMIYDKDATNPDGWRKTKDFTNYISKLEHGVQDLTPYEVHVQDFTGDSSWVSSNSENPTKRGTYLAFVESGTHVEGHNDISTGYDHLVDLGINAVHLNPVFDADNDESSPNMKYNWGYNPLNYNCVEGGYSSDPYDGTTRIKEYKTLVHQLSLKEDKDNSIRVIMDVVYNHVSSATSSCFTKLMPRYFFRYAKEGDDNVTKGWIKAGELYDGSACHNEVRTEAPMMRAYILHSLYFWATEYNIKGFRFDLMGLIDYETLAIAQELLYKVDPSIYMYGEGWAANGCHARNSEGVVDESLGAFSWQVYNKLHVSDPATEKKIHIGCFNNCSRDGSRGGNDSDGTKYPGGGFLQKPTEENYRNTQCMIFGSNDWVYTGESVTGNNPEQTVNYVSCHDNWTLRDQLYNTAGQHYFDGNPASYPASSTELVHASIAAHALVFASNAPAFMLGGEEIMRTKSLDFVPTWSSTENYQVNSYVKNEVVVGTDEGGNDIKAIRYFSAKSDITAGSWESQVDSWSEVNIAPSFETMWGHTNSHNSYNSPIDVNGFKWGNKIKINTNDASIGSGEYTDNDFNMTHVTDAFAKLIEIHKNMYKFRKETGAYEGDNIKSEGFGYNNCEGIHGKVGAYHVFVCARWGGKSCTNSYGLTASNKVFEFGSYGIDGSNITLGSNTNCGSGRASSFGFSTLIFKKG